MNTIPRLKLVVQVPLLLLLILVVAVSTFVFYDYQASRWERENEAFNAEIDRRLLVEISEELEDMQELAYLLAQDKGILDRFQALDRDGLQQVMLTRFEAFKRNHKVTRAVFITSDSRVFLRMHQPDQHGDHIARPSLVTAIKTSSAAWGIEQGPYGDDTLRYVTPLSSSDGGLLLGYLELGIEMQNVLDVIERSYGVRAAVLLRTNDPEGELWQQMRQRLVGRDGLTPFEDLIYVYRSEGMAEEDLVRAISTTQTQRNAYSVLNFSGDHEMVHLFDVINLKGIADQQSTLSSQILVAKSVSTEYTALTKSVLFFFVVGVLLALATIGLLGLYLGRMQRLITQEQVAVHSAMKERERRLEEAQRVGRLGSWELDHTTGAVTWSQQIYRLFELPFSDFEATYEGFLAAIHPDDRDKVNDAFSESLRERTPYFVEHRLLMRDGRVKYVEERGETAFDQDGKPLVSAGTMLEVTESVVNKNRLNKILELAVDGIHILDEEGDVIECSLSFAEALGYTPEEAKTLNLRDFKPEFSVSYVREIVADLMNSPRRFETIHHRKDGSKIEVEVVTAKVSLNGRDALYASARDISDRKAQERALLESQSRFQRLVNDIGDSFVVFSHRADTGEVLFASGGVLNVFGVSQRDILSMGWGEVVSWTPASLDVGAKHIRSLVRGEVEEAEFELQFTGADGELKIVQVLEHLVREGVDELPIIEGTLRDVTDERKLAMDLVVARDLAERANRAKSEFLATMSHEIRTPMNGVIAMADMLSQTALDESQIEYVDVINGSARNLLRIINDILDYSKIEAGMLEIESVEFDLRPLIEDTIAAFKHAADSKGVALKVDLPEKLDGLREVGDPTRIQQILINLISNALKFTHQGSVTVRLELVELAADRVSVKLSVTDTGIGISEEVQHALFERFTQADQSTTRQYGGTGLGLSISKQLAELMGGEIGVESTPNEGSTFWFAVPLGLAVLPTALPIGFGQPSDQPGTDLGAIKILIAEDNAVNRKVASTLLKKIGVDFELVEDGEQAVNKLRDNHDEFDLVFMDIQMPVMDGYAATRAVREFERINHLTPCVIIAMTANATKEDQLDCREAGMSDFLSKPMTLAQLRQMIVNWIPNASSEATR